MNKKGKEREVREERSEVRECVKGNKLSRVYRNLDFIAISENFKNFRF